MAQQLIRRVPDDLRDWLKAEAEARNKSQQALALEVLLRGRDADVRDRLPLFQFLPPEPESEPAEFLPFTFVDLFAGIGGMHHALRRLNGKCVVSVEWDKYCQKVYQEWYGEKPKGNINDIVDIDI